MEDWSRVFPSVVKSTRAVSFHPCVSPLPSFLFKVITNQVPGKSELVNSLNHTGGGSLEIYSYMCSCEVMVMLFLRNINSQVLCSVK